MKKYTKILALLPKGNGHYYVEIEYYNRILSGTLTVMPLLDLYKSGERGWKQAGNQIYDIIRHQN